MPPKAKETRENFEAGKVDGWTAGDYGHAVRLFVERGKLKVRHQKNGRPTQRTVFRADTPELRRKATAVAVAIAEKLRAGTAAAEQSQTSADSLTIREACLLYLQRVPRFEERLLGATMHQVQAWYNDLPDAVKESANTPAAGSVWSDVYAFRRLFSHARLAPDRKVMDLEPADATAYFNEYVGKGGSPRTAVADLDKLSCAFRYVIQHHRRTVGLTLNPIEGRRVDRTKADIAAYEPAEAARLRAAAPALAATGQWQVLVVGGIATSGRRLGAILGLTAADHDLKANTVIWRAKYAKGRNYGKGDVVRPMTGVHRRAVEWALKHRPNPLGPEAPLLWRSANTGRRSAPQPHLAVPQPTVWGQLMRLEELAKVPHLPRRAWHSFRRMMATILADEEGDGKAAEYIGMTPETLRKFGYKKVQSASMQGTAAAADRLLGDED